MVLPRSRRLWRLTNRRVRWLVGVGLLAMICIQCANPSEADPKDDGLVRNVNGREVGNPSDPAIRRLEELARTDPVALLERCRQHVRRTMPDYTCTFVKQERIEGALGAPQEIQVKFRAAPFSVAMRWTKNAPLSDRLLYVEGLHGGNLLLRPKGVLSLTGTVKRKPDSPQVMANTLHPVTMFGFDRSLTSMIEVYQLAARRGDLKTQFAGYKTLDGRTTLVLSRELPPRDDYPAARTLIYIDVRQLIPILIEAWDWDAQLSSRYVFKDVRANLGLTDKDFTPQANGL